MDWRDFVASLVGSVAWPAAAVAVFWMLRGPILGLLPFVERVSYKGLELEFRRRVEKLIEDTAGAAGSPPEFRSPRVLDERLVRLAEISPRGAVLESWIELEQVILEFARTRGWQSRAGSESAVHAFGYLTDARALPDWVGRTVRELQRLRNEAVHVPSFQPDPSDALGYAETAALVRTMLVHHQMQTAAAEPRSS